MAGKIRDSAHDTAVLSADHRKWKLRIEKETGEENERRKRQIRVHKEIYENDGNKQRDGFFLYFEGIDEKSVLHGSLYESRHQDRGAGNRHSCILRKENGREIFETVFQVFCESGHPGIRPAA